MTMTSQDFDDALERARLAAADLMGAADYVIRRQAITWSTAQSDADYQELSRIGHYMPMLRFDNAERDLDFAKQAVIEIDAIAAAAAATEAEAETESIGRLARIADDCERRAVRLRS
jgi:hypothetical protein